MPKFISIFKEQHLSQDWQPLSVSAVAKLFSLSHFSCRGDPALHSDSAGQRSTHVSLPSVYTYLRGKPWANSQIQTLTCTFPVLLRYSPVGRAPCLPNICDRPNDQIVLTLSQTKPCPTARMREEHSSFLLDQTFFCPYANRDVWRYMRLDKTIHS